jgi:hypothetical protein
MIVKDKTAFVGTFYVCTQCLAEGESYVTVSQIAFMVWNFLCGLLVTAIESPEGSQPVVNLARKMIMHFEE